MDPSTFPFRFTCHRSGNCCARPGGVVRVNGEEVAALAQYLGLSEAALRSRYLAATGDRLREGLGVGCVFLTESREGAACAVYPVRPERCRTWPFWPELRDDPEALAAAMRVCPGIERRGPATE